MRFAIAFILLGLLAPHAATAEGGAIKGVPIFKTPRFVEQESAVLRLVGAGALDSAAEAIDRLVKRYPDAPRLLITKAEVAARRGDADTAFSALYAAASLGYADLKQSLSAPAFQPLAQDDRMRVLLAAPAEGDAAAPPFRPGLVKGGVGIVGAKNTRWNADLARLEVAFALPPSQKSKPVSPLKDGAWGEVNKLVRRGRAAGNLGDIYDNRDDAHSRPPWMTDVQLTIAQYGKAARAEGLHYGLNEAVLFDGIAFGNSSTALKGAIWRSQARHALTTPLGAFRAWQLYDNNHIYVFPEHRDHDPIGEKGHGDLFPANTPLMLISQGSSGSDRRILQAIRIILAGLKPEVKAFLKEQRLIAPTVQQIFRRGMAGILTTEDYLSPAAHPTVFDQENVRLGRMLDLANGLEVGAVPPRAQIAVVDELRGAGPFASLLPEELFTTPDAIARLWRRGERVRRYRLSAAASRDANDRPLTYHWRVLRGDPGKVRITPRAPDASEVDVEIEWHEGMKSPRGLKSTRVDIALFADNGAEISAPAFFSLALPTHQRRVYSEDPHDSRPLSIAYLPPPNDRHYVDPVVWPIRNWNDAYDYGDQGAFLGWTRTYRKGGKARFTRHGLKVLENDARGRPIRAEAVRYELGRAKDNRPILRETPWERTFTYRYASDADVIGTVVETTGQ